LERSNRFLEKFRNIKFHEKIFSWSRDFTYEETHRQTEKWTDRTTRKCEQMDFFKLFVKCCKLYGHLHYDREYFK